MLNAVPLERAVGLDMGAWWKPTSESYFTHVSKATILKGMQQFAPGELTRLGKLTKADLASEAEQLAAGRGCRRCSRNATTRSRMKPRMPTTSRLRRRRKGKPTSGRNGKRRK